MRNNRSNSEKDNIVYFEGAEESSLKKVRAAERRIKAGRLYRISLIIFLVVVVVGGYLVYEKGKIYENYTVVASSDRLVLDGVTTCEFAGTILTYSKDGASAVDENGKLLWNQTFDMQSPLVSMCKDTVAFADYGGSTIYLQSTNKETGTISTDMPIRKIAVSSNGYVAAVLEDTDVTWIFEYDINGTVIAYFRTTMEKSGYPLDIDISPDGELICVSYYYVDCNDIRTSVAFYNFGPVGQNNIDNYVSGFNYSDTMVPYVSFLTDETAISLSSSRMSVYSGAHKPVSISDMFIIDEIVSVYHSDNCIAIIYQNDSKGSKYRMELYNEAGEKLSEKAFDFDYSGVTFGKDTVALFGDTSLYIGTHDGKVKYEGSYSEPMLLVVPGLNQTRYTIVTEKSIDSVEFK